MKRTNRKEELHDLVEEASRKVFSPSDILKRERDERFEQIAHLVSTVTEVPIAHVSFFEKEREWTAAWVDREGHEKLSFEGLGRALSQKGSPLDVKDLHEQGCLIAEQVHERPPYPRAYLGVPILDPSGLVIGCIGAADTRAHRFQEKDRLLLEQQADYVIALLGSRSREKEKKELEREISRKLLENEERTRHSIGRDIHDGIVQELTGIKLYAESLREAFAQVERKWAWQQFETICDTLDRTIEEARGVSHDLMLKDLHFGLSHALQKLFSPFMKEDSRLSVEFKDRLKAIDPSLDKKKNIYRILQEILNNTLKHSDSSKLKVLLYDRDEKLVVKTHENGSIPKDGELISPPTTIQDRVRAMGGDLKLAFNAGIAYEIQIPVP
jgi:signal transduction histidine kinase